MLALKSINPSNYQVLGEVAVSGHDEVVKKVHLARQAAKDWGRLSVAQRVSILNPALDRFIACKDKFTLLESREMGMPITEARADFDGVIAFARWYLENAEQCLAPETTFESDSEIHQVFREPIGVSANIIPWNYPFLNFVWNTWTSLLAGNTVVMKHSEECPLSGKLIEEIMTSQLPLGVFSEVYGAGEIGYSLTHQDIDLISFVGSSKTGWKLYEVAAKKRVKTIIELGGSAPGIVFEDADLDAAIKSICEFRLSNAGQYCDGLKRLIVHETVFEEVIERLSATFSERQIGAAESETTTLGPLVAKRQLDLLADQVHDALANGAAIITGGRSLEQELGGAFFQPTVLIEVDEGMRVWKEEVFGPVLPVVSFKDEHQAILLANHTTHGLGGYVYTQDLTIAARVAHEIQTGMVSVNGTNYTTPWNPFGGYKGSGMGRQHGKFGFHELTQIKVIAKPK